MNKGIKRYATADSLDKALKIAEALIQNGDMQVMIQKEEDSFIIAFTEAFSKDPEFANQFMEIPYELLEEIASQLLLLKASTLCRCSSPEEKESIKEMIKREDSEYSSFKESIKDSIKEDKTEGSTIIWNPDQHTYEFLTEDTKEKKK